MATKKSAAGSLKTRRTLTAKSAKPRTHEIAQPQRNDDRPFVVGIGASAGGLEAIESFFGHMQPNSGLAFVIVQHLSPDYKSLMVELLSKHTSMKVLSVKDGIEIEPNSIYLIPPKKNMTIFNGKLLLMDQDRQRGLNLPIDIFFRSLAEDLGERAIGVILSGTGSDGTLGVRAIKGAGGMVMVQEESSAKFDGMPKSALSTGLVDYVLNAEAMPDQLLRYVKHPFLAREKKRDKVDAKEDDGYAKILATLRVRTGVDFTFYKPNTIIRRIERRMGINSIDNIPQYVNLIQTNPSEVITLYKDLLIGVTKFFRDYESFEIMKDRVIPLLFREANPHNPLRVWVVGCSTGEEAYSLAMLFQEYVEAKKMLIEFKIFATDIDKEALEYASAGLYPDSIAVDISESRLHKYFRKVGNHYQVNESLRKTVVFAQHNITKDPPFSKIDLVTCRNLLIYLQPITQQKVLTGFRFSLNQHGVLFLGSSESIGELTNYFTTVDSKNKIYTCSNENRPINVGFFTAPAARGQAESLLRTDRAEAADREESFQYVQDSLLKEYIPPSMIIDSNLILVHTFGDVSRYLRVPTGKINLNVLKMVPEDLAIQLSIGLRKAQKDKERLTIKKVAVKIDGKASFVSLTLIPTHDEKMKREFTLVVIEEWRSKTKGDTMSDKASTSVQNQMHALEQELQYSKQTLQATIEELESANEELQSTNEELVASNEELQSTNEELQSVNEELYTVNSEHQKKIEELSELNDDVNNWFNVTHIGTIFLDLKLCVRKFTPAVLPAINLIGTDIARPITHISHNLVYQRFHADIEEVAATLQPRETEVQRKDGKWMLVRMLPYRTLENAVKGIIITIVDIDNLKRVQEKSRREHELLLQVMEHSPVGKILLDEEGRFAFANKRASEILGIPRNELLGLRYDAPENAMETIDGKPMPLEERAFTKIKRTRQTIYNHIQRRTRSDGTTITLAVTGSPMLDDEGNVRGAVLSFDVPHDDASK